MIKRILIFTCSFALLMGLMGCKKDNIEVNEMLDALNKSIITDFDHLQSSRISTFKIDEAVPEQSTLFSFVPMFSNGMVLQANATFKFYGSFDVDGPIAVVLDGQTFYSEVVNKKFEFYLGHFSYGGPHELKVYTQDSKMIFRDVMIGEVYLLSGQSNMAITLSQILKSANEAYKTIINNDINNINHTNIRFMTVGMVGSSEAMDTFSNFQTYPWDVLSVDNASGISATAFYFAKEIYEKFQIPIGVIISAVGATNTNTWIPEEEAIGMDQTYIKNISDADTPSRFFNGMVSPLKQYTFRGVIWYQGEGQHVKYYDNMKRLIDGWRRVFAQKDLNFLIIELPRIDFELGQTQESWFQVRKQQQELAKLNGVAYSVSIDFGIKTSETNDPMHPFDKDLIGKRAAHAFMEAFYQSPGTWSAPRLVYAGYIEGKLIIKLANVGDGLYLKELKAGFEISTDGNTFSYVEPQLMDAETIVLNTSKSNIKAIRYGYTYKVPEVFGGIGTPPKLSDLVCVYNRAGYPLDQFIIQI